jgi:DNA-binding NarL/FixJ family response regulator
VVVVGLPKDEGLAVACIEAGALGCVSEDEDTGRLIEAVLAVRQHDGYLAPELAPALLRRLRTLSKTVCDPQAAAARLETLTPRQHEILGLMARGSANGEIAARLVIAPGTVKNHVHNILTKLKARDRWEAVACAEVAARSGALDSLWPLAWLPWPTAPAGEVEGEFDIVERAAVDHPRLGEAGRARPGARSDRWN